MVDKWTVLERFALGSKMKREEWIIAVSRKASEIVNKYKIKYKPLTLMDISEEKYETAEKVWNAGIELAATMGCYDLETDRPQPFDYLDDFIPQTLNFLQLTISNHKLLSPLTVNKLIQVKN